MDNEFYEEALILNAIRVLHYRSEINLTAT